MMVKVCGITRLADAEAAVIAGASALGFNFYPPSPRYVAPEVAARMEAPGVVRVGVFVNEKRARVEQIALIARLDVAQLHGDESPDDYPAGVTVWKAARVDEGFDMRAWTGCPADVLLLDGPAGLLFGGAGRSFDWGIVRAAKRKVILAGGLDGGNVREAIEAARPWGVDACSKIESAPGIKDHAKMTEFIQAARRAFAC